MLVATRGFVDKLFWSLLLLILFCYSCGIAYNINHVSVHNRHEIFFTEKGQTVTNSN